MIGNFLPHDISPALILIIGGLLVPFLPLTVRKIYMLVLPILGIVHLFSYEYGVYGTFEMFGFQIETVRFDALSRIFALIFFIATAFCAVFGWYLKDRVQQTVMMVYPGASIGATLAGDFVTLFVFWELTVVTSVLLIWAGGTERAYKASMRYLFMQVSSGLLLLAGFILLSRQTGSIAFEHMELGTLATLLIFLSFGIKCAFPFLHNWVQDSYPESTVVGTVVLSVFTTKLAVYALARGFAGQEELIYIGAAMTLFPIFFAVIEDNLRKVLTYSLNNQLGFMVCAIGVGGALGISGAVGQAFVHIIYKSLLLMSMGAVLYRTGTVQASELGGLYKSMPWTAAMCIVGAMSISAFPLFAGFVTKGMIIDSVAHHHQIVVWLCLLFASAGVLEHAGIKVPYFAFFAHDGGHRVSEAPLSMTIAMTFCAAMCLGIGIFPDLFYWLLPLPVEFEPYTVAHVVTQMQLLLFATLAFVLLIQFRLYPPEIKSTNLDFDWFYRRLAPRIVEAVAYVVMLVNNGIKRYISERAKSTIARLYRHHGPEGGLARTWPSGAMAMWIAILLTIALGINFL